MNWLWLQGLAQVSVERILNALPEGVLVALFAWALLRVLRGQNSGTRFCVWFVALLTVAVLPLLGGLGEGRKLLAPGMPRGNLHSALTIPGSWAFFAFLAWVLGTGAAMVRLTIGLLHLRQLRRSCTAIRAADLDPVVRKTVDAIVASGAIEVATSERVRVPAAIGFWKPTIVLPAWALGEMQPDDLNVILLHEFAHLRRGDDWTNLIQKIVRALFFFHPAVWWIENRLSVEREMACDDAVLAETANPHGYASCLVSLLEKSLAHRLANKNLTARPWSMAQAAVHRAHEASLRLARILDGNRPVATRVWKPALGLVAAFCLVCLMALPLAPQFVAFDRGIDRVVTAGNSDHAYSAAVSQPLFQPLVSAHESDFSTRRFTARPPAVAGRQSAPAPVIAARMNAAAPHDPVVAVAVNANADPATIPEFRTLVFVEATQYGTAESPVWQFQVWRVTLVTNFCERMARVPVANSI
ncbi:MAG: M56 family metallopeptidase [Terriglobales bacterium]